MKPWMIRTSVVLTALLCLGTAGYAGQVWRARKMADRIATVTALSQSFDTPIQINGIEIVNAWRDTPWYSNSWNGTMGWCPRRTYFEYLRLLTGLNLPNNPDIWEAYFKAHPNLVWDDRLHRLVDPQPEAAP